jgi:hypothetical protein
MADEQAGIPASEATVEDRMAAFFGADASKPSSEPEGPEVASASAEEEPEQTEEQAEEAAPEDSGYEEVELDGETFKVPPKLKEAVLRQSDYTKKTQELAEHRRALQSQMQAVQIAQRFQQETAEDQAQLRGLEAQIAQYKNVNWQELDSETLIRAKHGLDQLKESANELRGKLGQKAQQFQQMSQQAINQFRAQRAESLQRLVPGWNSQADIDATRAALETGFTPDEVRDNFDARMGLLAWKAAQFDKLQSTKTAAVKQVQKAPPVVKPGATQGQNAVAQRKYVDARTRLKKSGSLDDFAAALLTRK